MQALVHPSRILRLVTEAYGEIVPLFYMDTLAGINFVPTEYVDVTDTIDTKTRSACVP